MRHGAFTVYASQGRVANVKMQGLDVASVHPDSYGTVLLRADGGEVSDIAVSGVDSVDSRPPTLLGVAENQLRMSPLTE